MNLLDEYINSMASLGASDLFISVGLAVSAKINGELEPLNSHKLSYDECLDLVHQTMTPDQIDSFNKDLECNFAISRSNIGRFRCNAFWQRNMPGMVIRRIQVDIPNTESLGIPDVLKKVIMAKKGLVLFVGGTGTGKSTSLASLIDHRNQHSYGHILTIEDPIEYLHKHKNCIITQREIGIDTLSFDDALKTSLRQAPDVILIGEIRSMKTMEYALSFADTGHLCVATLHANNANQAIERIMHLAPKELHNKLRFDLSQNIRAIVAQQLVPVANGKGRVAAIEVLLNSPYVSDLIMRNEIGELKEAMMKGKDMGMKTFDMALYDLYAANKITEEQALHHADSQNDLRLMIKMRNGVGDEGSLGSLSNVTVDLDN
ncbi:PilT/PilU family type 4a pilus ATPase [Glaciecola petra]|uniref:PilT/PilU family type 4a pilus ATPase n=1 Tax=Glaciecola petra TaxID=3075602 RepID=A0ABU2ZLP5_9ALTE|nr:PilT/PilU family type 4a pilus ATPase [Aestuariibacter sp. P117]MDT0593549.1 PilT/PilU family type 4a pilus ATPase [Aestuariibacter sp. P117]